MNRKKVITILIIILVLMLTPILCCGGFLFYSFEIEPRIWSIDAEMEEYLKKNFAIELPDEYRFVKGSEENGFDDTGCIYLYIIVDKEDFEQIYGKGWEKVHNSSGTIRFMGKDETVEKDEYYHYRYKDETGASIEYSAYSYFKIDEKKVHCYFKLPTAWVIE